MDVIGVGALNVDLFYDVPDLTLAGHRFVPGAEIVDDGTLFTRIAPGLDRAKLLARAGGGSAANTVVAMARMGFQTGFLGVTGKDDNGKFVMASMEGVDLSHVKRYGRAGVCVALLSGGERSLMVEANANDLFSFSPEDLEYLNGSTWLHLSSFHADSALLMQKQLLDLLDDDVYVSFSPGERYARRGLAQVRDIIARSRLVFLNEREMGLLTGLPPPEGSKALLRTGAKVVACTLGGMGALISTRTSEERILAKGAKAVDTTGAGDVFAAGFLAGYIEGGSVETCGRIGAAVAALSVTAYGREGYPDERLLRTFASDLG